MDGRNPPALSSVEGLRPQNHFTAFDVLATAHIPPECLVATKEHAGYIVPPSDRLARGDPECLNVFAVSVSECRY